MSGGRMIVGLCGPARSGKDTLAKALMSRGWFRGAFADKLKEECEKLIGKPFVGMTPAEKEFWRPLHVCVGELRRRQRASYWIDALQSELTAKVDPHRPVVVTDVRYANEVQWIQRQGGVVVLLIRPGFAAANAVEERSLIACTKLIPRSNTILNAGPVAGGRKCLLELVRHHYGKVVRYV